MIAYSLCVSGKTTQNVLRIVSGPFTHFVVRHCWTRVPSYLQQRLWKLNGEPPVCHLTLAWFNRGIWSSYPPQQQKQMYYRRSKSAIKHQLSFHYILGEQRIFRKTVPRCLNIAEEKTNPFVLSFVLVLDFNFDLVSRVSQLKSSLWVHIWHRGIPHPRTDPTHIRRRLDNTLKWRGGVCRKVRGYI